MKTIANTQTHESESTAPACVEVTYDDIRCRAYELFCNRNGGGGDDVSDWLQAERELSGAMGDQCASIADQAS